MSHLSNDDRLHAALLFDMDGTILTSIAAAERVWTRWALEHGLDPVTFLPTIHGLRARETIARLNLPGVDPVAEADKLTIAELEDMDGVEALPGAAELLHGLPPDRWAIVTSAPEELARKRIEFAGLPLPKLLITGESVSRGKPDPAPYLLAAEHLGVPIAGCLVCEDAPAGIQSAETAGASVLVLTATHTRPLDTPHPTIRDYREIQVTQDESTGGFRIRRDMMVTTR